MHTCCASGVKRSKYPALAFISCVSGKDFSPVELGVFLFVFFFFNTRKEKDVYKINFHCLVFTFKNLKYS